MIKDNKWDSDYSVDHKEAILKPRKDIFTTEIMDRAVEISRKKSDKKKRNMTPLIYMNEVKLNGPYQM